MKNFTEYLMESEEEKKYEFKIKVAQFEMDNDVLDRIEHALKAFDLESISKPKRLPITDKNLDFPSLKACEVSLLTAVLKYPCTDEQIRAALGNQGRFPLANIVVIPVNSPEELRREEDAGKDETTKKEAILTKDISKEKLEDAQPLVGMKKVESMLKELESQRMEFAKTEKVNAKSTNDTPQNNVSPVAKKQGKK